MRKIQNVYNPQTEEPVIRSSICTGEKTFGFRNRQTGAFMDVALIRDAADLVQLKKEYGIEGDIRTIY